MPEYTRSQYIDTSPSCISGSAIQWTKRSCAYLCKPAFIPTLPNQSRSKEKLHPDQKKELLLAYLPSCPLAYSPEQQTSRLVLVKTSRLVETSGLVEAAERQLAPATTGSGSRHKCRSRKSPARLTVYIVVFAVLFVGVGKGSQRKAALLLDFVQITSSPPTPPPPNLDNFYNFFEREKC